jgi:AraC-like DNA-binding protein
MPAPIRFTCQQEEVDTDSVAPGERLDYWHAAAVKYLEPLHVDRDRFAALGARHRTWRGSAGSFCDVGSTAMTAYRSAERCRRDGYTEILIGLGVTGDLRAEAGKDGDERTRRPGDLGVLDCAQPATVDITGPENFHRRLQLYLPRAAVTAVLGRDPARLHGKMLAKSRLAPMLEAQMRTLAAIGCGLDATARAIALQSVIDLALTTLRVEFTGGSHSTEADDGLFAAAQCFINRHFGETELSPDIVAANLRCSRAHLYRVFARRNLAVADYIREVRLQRARVALEGAAGPRETVGDIAFRCGFANPVYFARLFKERFGALPREARGSAPALRQAA